MAKAVPQVFVLTGGTGFSGEQLTRTALAQFDGIRIPFDVKLVLIPYVKTTEKVDEAIKQIQDVNGTLIHTVVDHTIRAYVEEKAKEAMIPSVDLIGPLMKSLASQLGQTPMEKPGEYHRQRDEYFKRIAAIEFSVDHDDGRKPYEMEFADIVILGVSRVGKTPVSMYLSTRGYKVSNITLVLGIDPPEELFTLDITKKCVGLICDEEELVMYRQRRAKACQMDAFADYAKRGHVVAELDFAKSVFKKGGFMVLDNTLKPVEEVATDILRMVGLAT